MVARVGGGSSPQDWFYGLPPITRCYFSAVLLLTATASFGLVSAPQARTARVSGGGCCVCGSFNRHLFHIFASAGGTASSGFHISVAAVRDLAFGDKVGSGSLDVVVTKQLDDALPRCSRTQLLFLRSLFVSVPDPALHARAVLGTLRGGFDFTHQHRPMVLSSRRYCCTGEPIQYGRRRHTG